MNIWLEKSDPFKALKPAKLHSPARPLARLLL
jgi:hypothetical protein